MLKNTMILFLATMGLVAQLPARADDDDNRFERLQQRLQTQAHVSAFAIAQIFLEQNFSDGQTETVIIAKGGDAGLKRFWLFSLCSCSGYPASSNLSLSDRRVRSVSDMLCLSWKKEDAPLIAHV